MNRIAPLLGSTGLVVETVYEGFPRIWRVCWRALPRIRRSSPELKHLRIARLVGCLHIFEPSRFGPILCRSPGREEVRQSAWEGPLGLVPIIRELAHLYNTGTNRRRRSTSTHPREERLDRKRSSTQAPELQSQISLQTDPLRMS